MKVNSVLSDMSPNATLNFKKMEDASAKILDLENEISENINYLVDLKQNIMNTIKKIGNSEYQTILEMRYLCFESWEKIAENMLCSFRQLYRIRNGVLNLCAKNLNLILKN
jgi:hypothetical protein